MPPSACSKRPRRVVCAPVKAPRSWPKSSDSSRSFGIAAVLMATKGPLARGLCLCSALATSSLPEPDSPVISTVTTLCESRPMARKTSCIAGAWPRISGICDGSGVADFLAQALLDRATDQLDRLGTSNGLGR